MLRWLILVGLAAAVESNACAAQVSYRRVDLDSGGQLHIITSTGRAVRPPKDSGQVAFEQVAISTDRRTVGWLALYPNCCTSYAIPLKLVLLTAGSTRAFAGHGLPIWRWSFLANDRRVAFAQAPV